MSGRESSNSIVHDKSSLVQSSIVWLNFLLLSPGKFDMIAIAVGTGGTITGIGKKFKEKVPYVEVAISTNHCHVLSMRCGFVCKTITVNCLVLVCNIILFSQIDTL